MEVYERIKWTEHLPMENMIKNKNLGALIDIWYLVITRYLQKEDIYYLCIAYPAIRKTFHTGCDACDYCLIRFENGEDWLDHMCDDRDGRYRRDSEEEYNGYKLTSNIDIFRIPPLRPKHSKILYKCEFCGAAFTTRKKLLKHFVDRHLASRCVLCTRKWTEGGTKLLQSHMHKLHKVPKYFTCTVCTKQYYCKSSLQRHKKMHDIDK